MIPRAASEGFWAILEGVVALGRCLAAAGASGSGVNRLPETNYPVFFDSRRSAGMPVLNPLNLRRVILPYDFAILE